jgi:hypothetical protein
MHKLISIINQKVAGVQTSDVHEAIEQPVPCVDYYEQLYKTLLNKQPVTHNGETRV